MFLYILASVFVAVVYKYSRKNTWYYVSALSLCFKTKILTNFILRILSIQPLRYIISQLSVVLNILTIPHTCIGIETFR